MIQSYSSYMRLPLLVACLVSTSLIPDVLAGDDAENEPVIVQVRAQMHGPDCSGCGGAVVVVTREPVSILGAFRIDASGDVDLSVKVQRPSVPPIIIFCSAGWLRNSADETRVHECGDVVHVKAENAVEQQTLWPLGSAQEVAKVGLCRSGEFAEILPSMGGLGSLEVIVRELSPAAVMSGSTSLGDVCFRVRRDVAAVDVELVGADGSPYVGSVVLAGLPHTARTMHGNDFYPHFALTQRGSHVRVLLTRAAMRLLRANPSSLLVLGSRQNPRVSARVEFVEQELVALAGGSRHLHARCVISSGEVTPEQLKIPEDWDYGEPSFL